MASEDQKNLATFIKNLHIKLRENAKVMGADKAWELHCQQTEILQQYATSMQSLAQYWDKNSQGVNKTTVCRIVWVIEQCKLYFNTGKLYQRLREEAIIEKMDNVRTTEVEQSHVDEQKEKFKLLDVGSCYNPFKKFDIFDVTAIDLAPANSTVLACDFLRVNCRKSIINPNPHNSDVTELAINNFDIVVFSLLLEYLPSSQQRVICCEKAYQILKPEGILIIITPDSKHVGANAQIMKIWRFSLACMGFMRIKYEKLPHVHCLIFRKCLYPEVSHRWTSLHSDQFQCNYIPIPQDFQKTNNISQNTSTEYSSENISFSELPHFPT